MTLVSTRNATAMPAPTNRFRAKDSMLLGFPPGSKFSSGSNIIQIPVNDLSNSSMETE